eukprot:scaffold108084_cov29-Tisochrysis_lutea.AAC.7
MVGEDEKKAESERIPPLLYSYNITVAPHTHKTTLTPFQCSPAANPLSQCPAAVRATHAAPGRRLSPICGTAHFLLRDG